MRAIEVLPELVNHRAPSGPVVMALGMDALAPGETVSVAGAVVRPIGGWPGPGAVSREGAERAATTLKSTSGRGRPQRRGLPPPDRGATFSAARRRPPPALRRETRASPAWPPTAGNRCPTAATRAFATPPC